MAGELEKFEAVFGAIAKITDDNPALGNARCPKCKAANFINVPDLYSEAVGRVEDAPEAVDQVHVGTMTDGQIIKRFSPPQRGSALIIPILVAIPLGVGAYFAYRLFGETAGELAGIAAGVIVIAVLMTSFRKRSDEYYAARKQWRNLFMCRECGQLVAP